MQQLLQQLTDEERQVLAGLLRLEQELTAARSAIAEAEAALGALRRQQAELQARVADLRAEHRRLQARLARRLRLLYEEGSTGYLEALLGAESLSDLIFRLEVIVRVAGADARLMAAARTAREELVRQEAALAEKAGELDRLLARRREHQERLEALVAQRARELETLRSRRAGVEAALALVQAAWQQRAIPVLQELAAAFGALPASLTSLQPDAVRYRLYPPGATVTLSEEVLNRFLQSLPPLSGVQVDLVPEAANVTALVTGTLLEVEGRFVPVLPATLRYEPLAVRLDGLPLPPELVAGALATGSLDLDLAEIIRPGKLQRVRMEEDLLVLEVGL
nr:MAG: hypothetical protein DIU70_12510 [Bacillota bacterium]